MPIIDGRVVRARLTQLKIDEISSVDNPAQPLALAAVLKRKGTDMSNVAKARAVFYEAVERVAKRDRLTAHQALTKARREEPAAFEEAFGAPEILPAYEPPAASAVSKAAATFLTKAREIAERDGITMSAAMTQARYERPDLFVAFAA